MSRASATAAAAVLTAVAGYGAHTWARYGRPPRRPRDELLDELLPDPEVDEYHAITVRAPADVTFAAATDMDLMRSPAIRAIFWLRAIPTQLRGQPFRPGGSRGLLTETLAIGWGLLELQPGRRVVLGAYTQPWHQNVTFRPLPADRFTTFHDPGYTKIVVTVEAQPLGPRESLLVTRTRVVATDPDARRLFRRYWVPMSTGIILIRYLGLPLIKRDAERRFHQQWQAAVTL